MKFSRALLGTSLCAAAIALCLSRRRRRRAGRAELGATRGALYSADWLDAVAPLARQHMGTENMGPLLYALVRFIKPRRVLEVGAGFTTLFILQALADNEAEIAALRAARAGPERRVTCAQEDGAEVAWCVEEALGADDGEPRATLLTLDNEEHEVFVDAGGLSAVRDAARRLGLEPHLRVLVADAFDVDLESACARAFPVAARDDDDGAFDFVWLDGITSDERFAPFFARAWRALSARSGVCAVHSTLTNATTRRRRAERAAAGAAPRRARIGQRFVLAPGRRRPRGRGGAAACARGHRGGGGRVPSVLCVARRERCHRARLRRQEAAARVRVGAARTEQRRRRRGDCRARRRRGAC